MKARKQKTRPRRAVSPRPSPGAEARAKRPPANANGSAGIASTTEIAWLKKALGRQNRQLKIVRSAVRQQMEHLDAIAVAPDSVPDCTQVLETTLREAHTQLVRDLEEIRRLTRQLESGLVEQPARRERPTTTPAPPRVIRQSQYDLLRERIRDVIHACVPEGATVVVVSRGDDALLKLDSRRGWHFPQNDDGVYAGHHPASSAYATRQLETLRRKGAQFLVFPNTAFWWLDHYAGFRRHLERRYRLEFREQDSCAIYDLRA
jgi:hypothetical protein